MRKQKNHARTAGRLFVFQHVRAGLTEQSEVIPVPKSTLNLYLPGGLIGKLKIRPLLVYVQHLRAGLAKFRRNEQFPSLKFGSRQLQLAEAPDSPLCWFGVLKEITFPIRVF
mgnify:CR=1 FL=1